MAKASRQYNATGSLLFWCITVCVMASRVRLLQGCARYANHSVQGFCAPHGGTCCDDQTTYAHCMCRSATHLLMATVPPRLQIKDNQILSRPNNQGTCMPLIQPTSIAKKYLLRVYRALCLACHLDQSSPSQLHLTHGVILKARITMKRGVPEFFFSLARKTHHMCKERKENTDSYHTRCAFCVTPMCRLAHN